MVQQNKNLQRERRRRKMRKRFALCLVALSFLVLNLLIPHALAGAKILRAWTEPGLTTVWVNVNNTTTETLTINVTAEFLDGYYKISDSINVTLAPGENKTIVVTRVLPQFYPTQRIRAWDYKQKPDVWTLELEPPAAGFSVALDRENIPLPSIALYSTVIVAASTTAICVKRSMRYKEKD